MRDVVFALGWTNQLADAQVAATLATVAASAATAAAAAAVLRVAAFIRVRDVDPTMRRCWATRRLLTTCCVHSGRCRWLGWGARCLRFRRVAGRGLIRVAQCAGLACQWVRPCTRTIRIAQGTGLSCQWVSPCARTVRVHEHFIAEASGLSVPHSRLILSGRQSIVRTRHLSPGDAAGSCSTGSSGVRRRGCAGELWGGKPEVRCVRCS